MDDLPEPLSGQNLSYVEGLYARFLQDSDSVEPEWQAYFAALASEDGDVTAAQRAVQGPAVAPRSIFNPHSAKQEDASGAVTVGSATAAGAQEVPPAPGATASVAPQPTLRIRPGTPEHLADNLRLLAELRLFRGLPQEELEAIAAIASRADLEADQALYREGEPGNSLYVVVSGSLVERHKGQVRTTFNVGDSVGEMAVLHSQPRSADVVAHGAASLIVLEGEQLLELVSQRPVLSRGMVSLLASRLRQRGSRQERVNRLIHAYRVRGHLLAKLDPLGTGPERSFPELELEHYGLGEQDLDALFSSASIAGTTVLPLREILRRMQETYCGAVGVQFMHIDQLEAKNWLQEHLEDGQRHQPLSLDEQRHILTKLTDAEIFEQFIHAKFLGAKRFSLEGAESLIPLLDLAIDKAARQGVREVVLGMAHRGRLNVLVNILGKSPQAVFREFDDQDHDRQRGGGDVKYHLGHSADYRTVSGSQLHLSLCFNPSHLEFVNPVLLGRVRAKQQRFEDRERRHCLGVVVHGDAAFAGQGVSQEILNLSDLPGYRTGGTLHIIVNNQIGFTTPPESGRSTRYATDVARMLQTPIFHVNGENPEAVAHVVRLALDFRERFRKDVIIDMYCYRRYGHNEGDEPSYTQPLLYEAIRKRKSVREGYLETLLKLGITREEADEIESRRRQHLDEELSRSRESGRRTQRSGSTGEGLWKAYRGGKDREVPEVETALPTEELAGLLDASTRTPDSFSSHPKLRKFLRRRQEMAAGERPLDWGAAEALGLGSLLVEGTPVRLSGQDSGRGTFSHRHSVLHDVKTGDCYAPLDHLREGQARFHVYDSPLSEVGVLGFEYGFSLDTPEGLVIWEAQFGDFCNVAQVIIDQFITSSEDKWQRLSGLVMLLPHGFEGQGPEHSSARLERFLNLAAEDNIQVVNLTTPAQLFHCLRRQVRRPLRKPLVVMSPKSLLRHPRAVSSLQELAEGSFQRVIPEVEAGIEPSQVSSVLLTSGKLYYELVEAREQRQRNDVAILRLEQYYPLSLDQLAAALEPYGPEVTVRWVQEEPLNMGAWPFLRLHLGDEVAGRALRGITRPESASPATGSPGAHKLEQAELIEEAFAQE